MKRWAIFAIGIAASLAITAVLWAAGIGGFALALLFPFALFGFRRPEGGAARACPVCGHRPRSADEAFCPRDGSPLSGGA